MCRDERKREDEERARREEEEKEVGPSLAYAEDQDRSAPSSGLAHGNYGLHMYGLSSVFGYCARRSLFERIIEPFLGFIVFAVRAKEQPWPSSCSKGLGSRDEAKSG